jgi:hypothetical protein
VHIYKLLAFQYSSTHRQEPRIATVSTREILAILLL